AQEGDKRQQFGLEIAVAVIGHLGRPAGVVAGHGMRHRHYEAFFPLLLSSASSILRSRSMKSSGIGSWATSSYMRRSSRPIARWRARIARAFSFGFSSLDTVLSHCIVGRILPRCHIPARFTPHTGQNAPPIEWFLQPRELFLLAGILNWRFS